MRRLSSKIIRNLLEDRNRKIMSYALSTYNLFRTRILGYTFGLRLSHFARLKAIKTEASQPSPVKGVLATLRGLEP